MYSKIYRLQFKLGILFLLGVGCKNPLLESKKNPIETNKLQASLLDSTTTTMVNGRYKLSIITKFCNDTVDLIDYKENIYNSPIILSQNLYFFKEDGLIKLYLPPLTSVTKKTVSKRYIKALQTPLYRVCLTRTDTNSYYILYGSDYCNGSDCPEFIGIYSMEGNTVYEGLSTAKNKTSLKEILLKYKIQINNNVKCIPFEIFK